MAPWNTALIRKMGEPARRERQVELILRVSIGTALGLAAVLRAAHLLCLCWEWYRRTRPTYARGLRLPPSLVRAIWRSGETRCPLRRGPFSLHGGGSSFWALREPFDAYGRPWPQGGLSLWYGRMAIENLAQPADPEGLPLWQPRFARVSEAWALDPGFVPYPTDFPQILAFGGTGANEGLYLDYRDDPQNPSVLCWDGVYWRRVAPSFEAFFSLLRPSDGRRESLPQWRLRAVHAQASAAIVALQETAQWDVWGTQVLLHIVYSRDRQPIVVLLPVDETPPAEARPHAHWRLQVTLSSGELTDPAHPYRAGAQVTSSGDVRKLAPASGKENLGRAVAAAIQYRLREHGEFCTPVLFRARDLQEKRWAYCVVKSDIAGAIGGTSHYFLSEDLSRIDFLGGM